jgi:tight adherence protein B
MALILAAMVSLAMFGLLGGGILLLFGGRSSARLQQRLQAIASPSATNDPALLVNIRVSSAPPGLQARLAQLVGRSPHVPGSFRLPLLAMLLPAGAAAGAAMLLLPVAGPVVTATVCLIGGAVLFRLLFRWELERCRTAMFRQIPDVMGLLLRAVRAGLPVAEAIRSIAREIPAPSGEEFTRVASEISIGEPLEQSLHTMAERTGLTEYAFFAVTIGLQSQTGGNLAETLENLADIVRRRVAMVGRVKAITAEVRASAGILVALPFVTGGILPFIAPGHLDPLFHSSAGNTLLAIASGMLLLGIFIIRGMLASAVRD